MNTRLHNEAAPITSGRPGIGAAIVKRLAQEGTAVAVTFVTEPGKAENISASVSEIGVRVPAILADGRRDTRGDQV